MELDLAKFQHKVAMDEFRKQTKTRLDLAQQSLRLRRLNPNLPPTMNPTPKILAKNRPPNRTGTIKPSWIPAEIPCDDEETFLDVWLRKRRARLAASAPHSANHPAGQEAIIQPRTHKDSSFPSIEPIPPANV